jgi:nitrogen fixation/metabolism regulation signal transduction histidine kinase
VRPRTGTIGIPRRVLLSVTLVLAATVTLTWGLAHVVDNPLGLIAAATAAALPIGYLINKMVIGPVRATLVALGDGLLSFAERDYGVRIAPPRDADIGELVARFNRLGEKLKTEHNDVYQREMVLETVLDFTPSAVFLVNEAERILFANSTARDLLGDHKKLEGRELGDILGQRLPGALDALGPEGDAMVTVDRDGVEETFTVARRFFTLSTQQHTLIVVKPLGRELAQREAEVWKKAIRVISHELNNSLAPITSLVHSARLIHKNPEHAHRLGAMFDAIEERAVHLKNFLEGYARLAKLPRPSPRWVEWSDFLGHLQRLCAFRLLGAPPAEPSWFDPAQLEQVVINLLKNAAESGSPSDDITLEVSSDDGGAELHVLDRGKGMSEEALRKAALPFYSTKKTGSGLGLALCRDIVDAHGGKLALTPRDGGGLAVSVWLPSGPATAAS